MKKSFKKFVTFSFTIIIAGVMFMSNVSAIPILSPEFFNACRNHDLETVKKIITEAERAGQDLNVSNEEFASPLAVAAHFGAKEIVSYLICHPKIDINKKIAIFDLECLGGMLLKCPLFFSLLYHNDYVNLKLLLDNPRFDIDSLYVGLGSLDDIWYSNEWKLDPRTREVLKTSKYRESFKEIIDSSKGDKYYGEVPYFYGCRMPIEKELFSETSSDYSSDSFSFSY